MSFHLYRINELYSNADGSIQYMEMVVGDADGEGFWQGQPLTVSQGGAVHRYLFPSDLPGFTTANTTVLIATQGFADLGLVTPDFVVPAGFLFVDAGVVDFAGVDSLPYAALPTDGLHSVDRFGTVDVNSPRNFAGDTATITPGRSPIVGTAAADTLQGAGGDDTIDGGAGVDTAVYPGARATYAIAWGAGGGTVADLVSDQGVDTLLRVERLHFADVGLAFDVDGSAGSTARLIVAAFGASFIEPGLSGVGIRIFDGGLTMEQVAQAALDSALFAQLVGGRDNETVVRTLYENVVGQPPPAAELLSFVGLLEAGMTQAQLLAFAAQHELNAQRIGLAGLAANGLEYL